MTKEGSSQKNNMDKVNISLIKGMSANGKLGMGRGRPPDVNCYLSTYFELRRKSIKTCRETQKIFMVHCLPLFQS